jgi:hypothetical protein
MPGGPQSLPDLTLHARTLATTDPRAPVRIDAHAAESETLKCEPGVEKSKSDGDISGAVRMSSPRIAP